MTAGKLGEHLRGEISYPLMHTLVKELREGQRISQCFLVKQKSQRSTRTGDPYLEILLADRSGTIPARAWAEAARRHATQFDEGDFVFAEGRTETYRNVLQLVVESIRRVEIYEKEFGKIPGFDPGLLVPTSAHNVDEMWAQIQALVQTLEPPPLRQLTAGLLNAYEASFKEFPAAIQYHHAYLGGLLEHTLEVATGVAQFSKDYPDVDHGVAVAGAILHDIGKVKEWENPVAPHHSFSGQLVGHLLLGRDMVREEASKIDWSDERLPELLEHVIVSHHGELEFGSAILPKTAEAMVVYQFDNLSAKLNMIRMHIANDTEDGPFTDWHKLLARKFFKGKLTTT